MHQITDVVYQERYVDDAIKNPMYKRGRNKLFVFQFNEHF